jgi:DNA replication protein DnaC
MGDDPAPVGKLLGEARRRLESAVASAPEPKVVPVAKDLGPDEIARLRHQGVQEARELAWGAEVPSRFRAARLSDFTGQSGQALTTWAEGPTHGNLVVLGPGGAGLSHAAAAACRPAFERGLEVMFAPVVEALDHLKPGGRDRFMEELCLVDRLILDDIGAERRTDWSVERLYVLVNNRWNEERPMVATSNLDGPALEAHLGTRTFSRLVGSEAVTVLLTGDDRRRKR